jgi:hypothetical protein
MLTTAGLSRSATSANDTPTDGTTRDGVTRSGRGRGVVADTAGAGVSVPATTSPTRNATVAERTTVAARNRRVIAPPL